MNHPAADAPFQAEELLARVGRSKDRDAFVALFRHYAPRVKSWLLKNGADNAAAEEILQNTFVSVWEKAAQFDPARAAASTWIFTIARNRRIDSLRRDRRIDFNSDSRAIENAVAPENTAYADGDSVERLNAAIGELPPDQAKLLRMAFFEDKSHSAISQETHLPLGTVKSRLRIALNKLKKIMGGRDA